jgi:TonB family protein
MLQSFPASFVGFARVACVCLAAGAFVVLELSAGEAAQSGPREAVEDASTLDSPPRLLTQTHLKYPWDMRFSGYRGRVTLDFVVGKDGHPRDAKVVASNHPAFEAAALAAVESWRFEPARKAGEPVAVRVRQQLVFKLQGQGGEMKGVDPFRVPLRTSDKLPEEFRYDVPPELDLAVAPTYPRSLAVEGVEGSAEVVFVLDAEGVPAKVDVVEASHPDFGAAVAAAIEAWRFTPAQKKGAPCQALLTFKVDFHRSGVVGFSDVVDSRLLAKLKKNGGAELPGLADLDAVPRVVHRVEPVYPLRLRETGVEGRARVRFIIDREGVPRFPSVESADHEAFAYAALTAVQRQRFERPCKAGQPVDAWAVLPVNFRLKDAPAAASTSVVIPAPPR